MEKPAQKTSQKVRATSPQSQPKKKGLDWWLVLLVFLSGASLMSFEIVGSYIIAPTYGSSIYTWGSLIGIVMLALSIGYYFGGMLADRKPSFYTLAIILALAGSFVVAVPYVSLPICEAFKSSGQKWGSLLTCLMIFTPASIMMGMVSPMAIRLQTRAVESVGGTAGTLYAISTFGSIAGTFLTSFVLITEMGVFDLTRAIGLLLLASAVISVVTVVSRERKMKTISVVVFLIAFGIGGPAAAFATPLTIKPQAGTTIVASQNSAYNTLYVLDYAGGERALQFNHRRESGFNLQSPERSSFSYTAAIHACFGLKPDIKDILLIGGGGVVLPIEFVCAYPGVTFDSVEIDPGVVEYGEKYFKNYAIEFFSDPKNCTRPEMADWSRRIKENMHEIEADGRLYVKQCNKKYDMIIMDAYLGGRIPFHLTTKEFFTDLTKCLKDDGLLAMNIISGFRGKRGHVLRSIHRTVNTIYPNICLMPLGLGYTGIRYSLDLPETGGYGEPGATIQYKEPFESSQNVIMFASRTNPLNGKIINLKVRALIEQGAYAGYISSRLQGFLSSAGSIDEYNELDRAFVSRIVALGYKLDFRPIIDEKNDPILTDSYAPVDVWSGYTMIE